jgi:hypothetical protein
MEEEIVCVCQVCGLDDPIDEQSFRLRKTRYEAEHTPVTPDELAAAGKDGCYNCKVIYDCL